MGAGLTRLIGKVQHGASSCFQLVKLNFKTMKRVFS